MVTTTRHPRHPRAYTIIESLVVLTVLAVITMVVIALLNHRQEAAQTSGAPTSGLSPSTPQPASGGKKTE
ncbi:type II secretion system protein [Akkermansiaceae bacterium]|nr:type II secretion system protein [Akkermansiaceae bacterium]